jgi:serine/threonine protein kinase, bacterial
MRRGEGFAGYTVLRLLGSGGMGEVYLAQHPRLPRRDALKVLPADVSADREFRERFHREADLAASLFHPHIVGVHDRGEYDGQLWISMDYVEGPDTARLFADGHAAGLPTIDVLEMVTAVGEALDYAHGKGLLHRDVKPANVLTTQPETGRRRILLADFGIARRLDDISGLTATNMTAGTLSYAAPEQLMGQPVDGRTDQYALAATAVHWLTGAPLVIGHHLNAEPPRLADARPDLAAFDRALARALAKDAADRFASCTDFAEALGGAAAHPDIHAAPTVVAVAAPPVLRAKLDHHVATAAPSSPSRPLLRSRVVLGVLGAVVAGVITLVVVLLLRHGDSGPQHAAGASSVAVGASSTTARPQSADAPGPPVPAASPASTAAPTQPSSSLFAIPACYSLQDPPTERPTEVTSEYCGEGGADLDHMSWSKWGPDGAEGTGYFSFNTCQPNCAAGGQLHYPAKIVASNPVLAAANSGCPPNTAFYSDLILAFPTSVPNSNGQVVNSQYQGMPAIRFTSGQNQGDAPSGGPTVCW